MKMFRSSKRGQWIIAFLLGAVVILLWTNEDLKRRSSHQHTKGIRQILNFDSLATISKNLFVEDNSLVNNPENAIDDDGALLVENGNHGDEMKARSYLDEPIDMHLEYEYVHNPISNCIDEFPEPRKDDVFLIFLVFSSPERNKWRQAIRDTYGYRGAWDFSSGIGNEDRMVTTTAATSTPTPTRKPTQTPTQTPTPTPVIDPTPTRTIFLLGATSDQRFQAQVDSEFNMYRDIVQESFVDGGDHGNLTRKLVMGLKWVTKFCLNTRYVMFVHDSMMMNQRRLLATLRGSPTRGFAAGTALTALPVERRKRRRYSLPAYYYPPETYPPFLRQAGVLSIDVAVGVYRTSLTIPFFPIVDVFVGTCLQSIGVQLTNFDRFLLGHLSDKYTARQRSNKARSYTLISSLTPRELRWMWDIGRIQH